MTDPKKTREPDTAPAASSRPGQSGRGAERKAERDARLAEQLRANLKKRKQQQRTRGSGRDGDGGGNGASST